MKIFDTYEPEAGGNVPMVGALHYLFEVVARHPYIVLKGDLLPSQWVIGTDDYSWFYTTGNVFVPASTVLAGKNTIKPYNTVYSGSETTEALADYVKLSWSYPQHDWAMFDMSCEFLRDLCEAQHAGGDKG